MADKRAPLGICDLCGSNIPRNLWYTSKRQERLYCTRECRNTANSRNGEQIRHAKLLERMAQGHWRNPAKLRPPTSSEQGARARKGRLYEVAAGKWRNPALTDDARRKLSVPRKHTGVLASAIEKLKQGACVSDLTQDEQDAYRQYRRDLRKNKKPIS